MPQVNPRGGSTDNFGSFRPLDASSGIATSSTRCRPKSRNIRFGGLSCFPCGVRLPWPCCLFLLAGQAETIPISNDNQVKKQDINAPLGDTYDDEIANRVARDVLSKATKEGWPLSSSVRDCYNQARQQETDILYCITLDILNYKFSHGSIEYAELQSVIERADATLSALGRQNETAFAVTHAMRISNRVRDILDTTVELESQPEPPPATPPEAAVPHTPSATASAPPAGNAPPPSPTTTASNPPGGSGSC